MCVGPLGGGNRRPATPTRQAPAPTMKAAAPPAEMVSPEKLRMNKAMRINYQQRKRKLSR